MNLKKKNTFEKENRIGYFQKNPEIESIYVGNLSYKMNKGHIAKLFENHGKVKYIKVIVDPKSGDNKGIAFVQMATKDQTSKAVQALDKTIVKGRTLKVSLAKNKHYFPEGKKQEEKKTISLGPEVKTQRKRDKKKGLKELFDYLKKP